MCLSAKHFYFICSCPSVALNSEPISTKPFSGRQSRSETGYNIPRVPQKYILLFENIASVGILNLFLYIFCEDTVS
jgi:hypothetical protein